MIEMLIYNGNNITIHKCIKLACCIPQMSLPHLKSKDVTLNFPLPLSSTSVNYWVIHPHLFIFTDIISFLWLYQPTLINQWFPLALKYSLSSLANFSQPLILLTHPIIFSFSYTQVTLISSNMPFTSVTLHILFFTFLKFSPPQIILYL